MAAKARVQANRQAEALIERNLHQEPAIQERYKLLRFLCVTIASLQGIAERPLPCNYNVFDFGRALSRR